MSQYTKSTNFATKDNLSPGDPLKIVRGTEIDTEFNNIATAISTKTDNSAAAITGGSITGITDLAIADGGTGASTATAAINNLLPSQTSNANKYLQTDGTNVSWDAVSLSTADITGTLPVANGGTGVTTSTGTGSVVLSNSPTLVTPALGTPASGVATNLTGLPISTGVSGLGTGVATFLGTPSSANLASAVSDETGSGALVFANSPTLVTPALGTPSALVGTNITGTASGLTAGNVTTNANLTGAVTSVGNATSLGSFSSANLLGALTDETGTGSAVFATSPTLVTPILGTPTSATLTNATGLPISTGVSGLGTGVATALAVNVGSAGAPVVNGGALGTPSSGTVTNLTGTASININGTVGATTPASGSFTTLTTSSTVTHNAGTANGVAYLNGSKVLTTGSALTFDGAALNITPVSGNATSVLTGVSTSGAFTNYKNVTADHYIGANNNSASLFGGIGGANSLVLAAYGNLPIGFGINGSEAMRLTSTGLGIGTSSPSYKLDVSGTAGYNAYIYDSPTGGGVLLGGSSTRGLITSNSGTKGLALQINGVTALDVDTSGNVGIGTSSPATKLTVYDATTPQVTFNNGTSTFIVGNNSGGNNKILYGTGAYPMIFYTNATEAMRIDASGNLLVGTTAASGNGERLNVTGSSTSFIAYVDNTSTGARRGIISTYSGSSPPNDTGNEFIYCNDLSAVRMTVRSNGGIANFSGNDVNLSDRREKTNFAPAKSYLETICAIPVQTFNYIDQNMEDDSGLTLGVVAQDVQTVAPELVMESNWGSKEDPKMRLSIYQTDLQYALMKCIQEQQALITALTARLDAAKI